MAGTLAAPSIFLVGAIELQWMSARRGSDKDRISPKEIRSLSRHFRRILVVQSHPPARSFRRNKNPQTHPEASLLVPTESGRRDFESLLERDSKAQPPVCIHRVLIHIAATRPRTEAGRSNGLWFQSFFVVACGWPPPPRYVLRRILQYKNRPKISYDTFIFLTNIL